MTSGVVAAEMSDFVELDDDNFDVRDEGNEHLNAEDWISMCEDDLLDVYHGIMDFADQNGMAYVRDRTIPEFCAYAEVVCRRAPLLTRPIPSLFMEAHGLKAIMDCASISVQGTTIETLIKHDPLGFVLFMFDLFKAELSEQSANALILIMRGASL